MGLSKRRLPRRLPSSSTTPNSVPHKFKFPAPLDLTMMMEATSHKTPSETAMRSHKKRNPVPVSLLSTLPTATYSVTRPSRRPSISTPSTEFPTASCPPSPTSIRYHATDKAKSVDQSYGVTQKANNLLTGLTSYFEKAAGTPTGQKLVNFYTQSSKQVQDIHAEARRLADLKKQDSGVTI